MSDFPSTDNIQVAAIAAALSMANNATSGGSSYFEPRLKFFLTAYKAIMQAVKASSLDASQINVEELMGSSKH